MFDTSYLHPQVVHFPIALILTGFLADLLFLFYKQKPWLRKTGFFLMVLGALGALVAVLTGEFFTSHPTEGEVAAVFEKHETAAFITLSIIWIGVLFRVWLAMAKKEESSLRWIVFALYLIAAITVAGTGHLGGYMVYNYMIGL